jgi:hypothetical protein
MSFWKSPLPWDANNKYKENLDDNLLFFNASQIGGGKPRGHNPSIAAGQFTGIVNKDLNFMIKKYSVGQGRNDLY